MVKKVQKSKESKITLASEKKSTRNKKVQNLTNGYKDEEHKALDKITMETDTETNPKVVKINPNSETKKDTETEMPSQSSKNSTSKTSEVAQNKKAAEVDEENQEEETPEVEAQVETEMPISSPDNLSSEQTEDQNTQEKNPTKATKKQKTTLEIETHMETEISTEPSESQQLSKVARNSRKRKPETIAEEKTTKVTKVKSKAKRQKVLLEVPKISTLSGKVFVIGENDVGQLGFSEEVENKKRPVILELPYSIVGIAAGGMHSVCLTESGKVITFGCNDEGALGRETTEEGSENIPQTIDIPERIVQVSAGDSHSAALSESGKVYIWGNFRSGNGPMGLVRSGANEIKPVKLKIDATIVKIASGSDHLVCLSEEGVVYTCGCGEAGQLGRLHELASESGGRKGIMSLLQPSEVSISKSKKQGLVKDVWTGSYTTFVKTQESGSIYGFGLNNYNQLGIEKPTKIFKPKHLTSFNNKLWQQIDGGQHHTLALDDTGLVYSFGRADYGRLGLGENNEVKVPTEIPTLQNIKCIDISSGNVVSFAVSDDGNVYSWGFGTNHQLGHGNDDDQHLPRLIEGNLRSWKAFKVAGGGQHTLILACARGGSQEQKTE